MLWIRKNTKKTELHEQIGKKRTPAKGRGLESVAVNSEIYSKHSYFLKQVQNYFYFFKESRISASNSSAVGPAGASSTGAFVLL